MQILPSFTKLINYLQSSTSFSRLPPNIHVAKTTLVMTTTCGMIESYQKKCTHTHTQRWPGWTIKVDKTHRTQNNPQQLHHLNSISHRIYHISTYIYQQTNLGKYTIISSIQVWPAQIHLTVNNSLVLFTWSLLADSLPHLASEWPFGISTST